MTQERISPGYFDILYNERRHFLCYIELTLACSWWSLICTYIMRNNITLLYNGRDTGLWKHSGKTYWISVISNNPVNDSTVSRYRSSSRWFLSVWDDRKRQVAGPGDDEDRQYANWSIIQYPEVALWLPRTPTASLSGSGCPLTNYKWLSFCRHSLPCLATVSRMITEPNTEHTT